jgi:hypothetical protein
MGYLAVLIVASLRRHIRVRFVDRAADTIRARDMRRLFRRRRRHHDDGGLEFVGPREPQGGEPGGHAGARIARRLDARLIRGGVLLNSSGMTVLMFIRVWLRFAEI